jgi:hypothetical protein
VNSDEFYRALDETSYELQAEIERRFNSLLDEHEKQLRRFGVEPLRSRGEYAIELLTFGVLLGEFGALAAATSAEVVAEMEALYRLRTVDPNRKADADRRRGELFADMLWGALGRREKDVVTRPAFGDLLRWLSATGEFVQEAHRLETWRHAYVSESEHEFASRLAALTHWFRSVAHERLGQWTSEVEAFRTKILEARVPREDLLLVTRREVLYHLNLLGAKVMNLGFESGYVTRPRKVVLLPGCMRAKEGECRARREGLDIQCTHCSSQCQVSAITKLGALHGFEVYIVPHASSFTAWLEHWRGDGSTALVAAACPLHLVSGGYEMRALGIDAQCVFLDFSGCRRHWHAVGTPTHVDARRLLRVVKGDSIETQRTSYSDKACDTEVCAGPKELAS